MACASTLCVIHYEKTQDLSICADSSDRVKKINEHIRSKTKIPVEEQILMLGSKTLKPQRKLSSYGIDKEATIHLTLKVVKPSDEELPVVLVDTRDGGQTYELQVRRSSSVSQVKEMIEAKTALRPKKQVVICNGKRLEDGKTMGEYFNKGVSCLFLTSRCFGG